MWTALIASNLHPFVRIIGSLKNLLEDRIHNLVNSFSREKVCSVKEHEFASILQHQKELLPSLPWNDVILSPVYHDKGEARFPQCLDLAHAHKMTPAL